MKKAKVHMKGLNKSRCGIEIPNRSQFTGNPKLAPLMLVGGDEWSKVTCKRCQTFYRSWHWQEADQAPWENN